MHDGRRVRLCVLSIPGTNPALPQPRATRRTRPRNESARQGAAEDAPTTHAHPFTPAPPRPNGAKACRGGCSEAVLSLAQPAVPIPATSLPGKGQRKPTPPPTHTLSPPPLLAPRGRRNVAASMRIRPKSSRVGRDSAGRSIVYPSLAVSGLPMLVAFETTERAAPSGTRRRRPRR